MTQLQLAPPYIYGYEYPLPNGEPGWIVTVDIAARVEPTPGQKIKFRATGDTWRDAVEQAAQQALAAVADTYRRDLTDTPYRYFPRKCSSFTMSAPHCTDTEIDETITMMITYVQALKDRAKNKKYEADNLMMEKRVML